jgi:ABC-type dipeptide/oligopeptide/nickel transport system permease component
MTNFILRRLAAIAFVLLIVSVLVFFLMNAVPGGPFTLGERGYTPDALANLERKYGLDKPIWERYLNFLIGALQLDFGNSFSVAGNPPVTTVIARTWPVTLHVGLYTIITAFGLGFIATASSTTS